MSQHVSKQITIAQKQYTRGGQTSVFSESSLSALSKKFKMVFIVILSKTLASLLGKISCDGVVFT